jgi:hypothetical protein
LRAIHEGEVDALVVAGPHGEQLVTLKGADYAYCFLIEDMSESTLTLTLTALGLILYANRRFAEMVKMPLAQVMGAEFQCWVASASQALLIGSLAPGVVDQRRQ